MDKSIGDQSERISHYIDRRQELVEDIDAHFKDARNVIREARKGLPPGHQKNDLTRALAEINDTDGMLLKERYALVADRTRVKYNMLGQPDHVKLRAAYLMAIAESTKKHGRLATDRRSLRNRLIKTYCSNSSTILESSELFPENIWCPVFGKSFFTFMVKAAHIVPQSIGETNAAYLFGSQIEEGFNVIWSEKNGLMMHSALKKLFDDGSMVIIPDPTDENEFISILLCQDLLKETKPSQLIDAPISTIHRKRLQFQTDARPGKRYLYVHALIQSFRRRRYDAPGWEHDREKVFTGGVWASPGKWARKSMVEALALEIGDIGDFGDEEGLGDFPNAKPAEEEKRMATKVRYAWETAIDNDNEDEDGEDEDVD